MTNVDSRPVRVLSLCAGIGGLDLGVKLAIPSAVTVAYVEHEAYAAEILASRMEDEALDDAPLWSNLKTFDGKPWRGVVDLVVGGYPCQPFSVAGRRQGTSDPRHLWPHVARIVKEVQPRWCFFENVPGHLRLGGREVIGELHGLGYEVAVGVFSAEEVGASHKRERLFILADSNRRERDGLHERVESRYVAPDVVRGGARDSASTTSRTSEVADSRCGSEHGDESRWGARQDRQGAALARQGRTFVAHSQGLYRGLQLLRRRSRQDSNEPSRRLKTLGNSALNVKSTNPTRSGSRDSACKSSEETLGHPPLLPQRESWHQRLRAQRREQSLRANDLVGDPNLARLEGRIRPFQSREDQFPPWPPSPEERDRWTRILALDPSLEPAICRVADGYAPWMDRLRGLGNAVVPIVAAKALVTLAGDLYA